MYTTVETTFAFTTFLAIPTLILLIFSWSFPEEDEGFELGTKLSLWFSTTMLFIAIFSEELMRANNSLGSLLVACLVGGFVESASWVFKRAREGL